MVAIILILLGVGCEVVKANAWFVIPEYVSYILFGLGGLMFMVNIINFLIAKSHFNKVSSRINKKFNRW